MSLKQQDLNENLVRKESVIMKQRIISDPQICGGEPCIKGTRIPVHIILSHLAAGDDFETILKNFPRLSMADIRACIEYASYLATEKEMAIL